MSETRRDIADYLEDALTAMDKAEEFVCDMSYEQFAEDDKTVFAGNSSATKAPRHQDYNIILLIPFLTRGTLKLIRNPRRLSANFK